MDLLHGKFTIRLLGVFEYTVRLLTSSWLELPVTLYGAPLYLTEQ